MTLSWTKHCSNHHSHKIVAVYAISFSLFLYFFSLLVNDLPAISESCSTECYVDDTKLLLSFKVGDADEAKDTIQKDLHLIRNWCFDNCLLLNPEKTKLMIFGSRPMIHRLSDFKLLLLGKELLPSESIKDLGVTFNPLSHLTTTF